MKRSKKKSTSSSSGASRSKNPSSGRSESGRSKSKSRSSSKKAGSTSARGSAAEESLAKKLSRSFRSSSSQGIEGAGGGRPARAGRPSGGGSGGRPGRGAFRSRSQSASGKALRFLTGRVKRHPDGFGFFISDSEHADVYIPRQSMRGVMSQDRVMIEVEPEKGSDRFRGEIVKILERSQSQVLGLLEIDDSGRGVIRDESHAWGGALYIPRASFGHAKAGDYVVARVTSYPEEEDGFEGEILRVLGDLQDAKNDIDRVLAQGQIPLDFSKETETQMATLPAEVSEEDKQGRKDLRDLDLITIDGQTAKDFDDAVCVHKTAQGFHLWVAIADVSHYVRSGTPVDKDAYERGTSVYFPGHVVPMLPEALSNELCSLKPQVDRLALVAEMELDHQGEMTKSSFYEAVIRSKARVIYGEAQEVIEGNTPAPLRAVEKVILQARELAEILMRKRFREGSLDLEIPETEVLLDAAGNPIDLVRSERLFAHRLIEELMLAANVAVAKFLSDRKVPSLYRVHEDPKPEALGLLERFIHNMGEEASLSGARLQKKISQTLQHFDGRPEAQVLHILALRSMSQAKYSVDNLGHFGLGFEFYSHFTSPIRRYPDLIIHRLIKNQVMPSSPYRLIPEDDLRSQATWLSACEQRAVKVERNFVSIKKARYLVKHVGEEFEGVISSVTRFGFFVLLKEFDADGLVRAEGLDKGPYEFDEEAMALFSKKTGISYRLGDTCRVCVDKADIISGFVDFSLVVEGGGPIESGRDGKKDHTNSSEHKKAAHHRGRVRKARVSQSGGESSARKVSSRKGSVRRGRKQKRS